MVCSASACASVVTTPRTDWPLPQLTAPTQPVATTVMWLRWKLVPMVRVLSDGVAVASVLKVRSSCRFHR